MKKLVLFILIFVLAIANIWVMYSYRLKSVSKEEREVEFIIEKGETLTSIASKLKEKNLHKKKSSKK